MQMNPRQQIGETLTGDVLEIGPGGCPFPTAPGARVKYVDRSVEGGRDANWPELIGQPSGIDADFDINLDIDALAPIADGSFDAVVASHLLEHLANPVKAIREFERALRPGGKLVLILPDRTKTFDAVRVPTELSHVLDEFHGDVTEVSDAHIIDFCEAIYKQSPIHPGEVREWHNPAKLDDTRLALHRRRSIHVHCWSQEEFAALIAGLLAQGLISFKLRDLYFVDDFPGSGEFGLVLERSPEFDSPRNLCIQFIDSWVSAVMLFPQRDVQSIGKFQQALCRDANEIHNSSDVICIPTTRLLEQLVHMKHEMNEQAAFIAERESFINSMINSSSWRCTAPLRKAVEAVRRFL